MILKQMSRFLVFAVMMIFSGNVLAQEHKPTGLVPAPAGPVGLEGNEFAVATSGPWPDPVPTHIHVDDSDPFGVGTDFAEVGECCTGNSAEENRGLAEFDLAGQTTVGTATLQLSVNAQEGLFQQPGGDFEIVLETYDGNNLEELEDYSATATGTIGTFTTGGLLAGEILTFDVTTPFNQAVSGGVPALGVLARASNAPNGAAIVLENFVITTETLPVTEIPTLSTVGLVALVLLISAAGLWISSRRGT